MKIALVTEDGQTISQHFGRAAHYLVVTIEDGKIIGRQLRDKLGHTHFANTPHVEQPGERPEHDVESSLAAGEQPGGDDSALDLEIGRQYRVGLRCGWVLHDASLTCPPELRQLRLAPGQCQQRAAPQPAASGRPLHLVPRRAVGTGGHFARGEKVRYAGFSFLVDPQTAQ